MNKIKSRRRGYYVKPHVQDAILRQVLLYWLLGFVTYSFVILVWRIAPYLIAGEGFVVERVWYHLAPTIVSSVVLLPFMLIMATRFSHRFVGPMIRFQQIMRQCIQGQTAAPITLRRGDFWMDTAKDLNQLTEKLNQQLRTKQKPDETLVEC